MNNKKIFELIFWVLMSVLMFILITGFALTATLFMLIAPVPFMLITRRLGPKMTAIGVLIGVSCIYLLSDPFTSIIYIITFCALGVAFGTISLRAKNGFDYMLFSIAASVFSKIILITVFSQLTGSNPFMIDPEVTNKMISTAANIFSKAGISAPSLSLKDYAKILTDRLSLLMPSMLILFAAMDSLLSYCLASHIVKRLKYEPIVKMPPFGEWRCPQNIFLALLVSLAVDLASRAFPDKRQLVVISANLLEVLRAIFIIQGLSLAWYFMTLRKVHRFFKSIFVIFGIIFSPISYILYIVGIFDICYDLRKLIRRKLK